MRDKLEHFAVLEQRVREIRQYGVVRAGARELPAPTTTYLSQGTELALVNSFMKAQGFAIPKWWVFLNAIMANETLAGVIHKDMAYDSPMNDEVACKQIAQEFICLFDQKSALFLSNGMLYAPLKVKGSGSGWDPLTSATFDGGVVGFDGSLIAYFWFEDED